MPITYTSDTPAEGVRINPYESQFVPVPLGALADIGKTQMKRSDKFQEDMGELTDLINKVKSIPQHDEIKRQLVSGYDKQIGEFQDRILSGEVNPTTPEANIMMNRMAKQFLSDPTRVGLESSVSQKGLYDKLTASQKENFRGRYGSFDSYLKQQESQGFTDESGQLVPFTHAPFKEFEDFQEPFQDAFGQLKASGQKNLGTSTIDWDRGVVITESGGRRAITGDDILAVSGDTAESLMGQKAGVDFIEELLNQDLGVTSLRQLPADQQQWAREQIARQLAGYASNQAFQETEFGRKQSIISASRLKYEEEKTPRTNMTSFFRNNIRLTDEDVENATDVAEFFSESPLESAARKASAAAATTPRRVDPTTGAPSGEDAFVAAINGMGAFMGGLFTAEGNRPIAETATAVDENGDYVHGAMAETVKAYNMPDGITWDMMNESEKEKFENTAKSVVDYFYGDNIEVEELDAGKGKNHEIYGRDAVKSRYIGKGDIVNGVFADKRLKVYKLEGDGYSEQPGMNDWGTFRDEFGIEEEHFAKNASPTYRKKESSFVGTNGYFFNYTDDDGDQYRILASDLSNEEYELYKGVDILNQVQFDPAADERVALVPWADERGTLHKNAARATATRTSTIDKSGKYVPTTRVNLETPDGNYEMSLEEYNILLNSARPHQR